MVCAFPQKVLFKHSDPAGIVFYPRYFEMMNDVVEAFFSDIVDVPLEKILEESGVPTVRIETVFQVPSRHGDELIIRLKCVRVGRSSLDLQFEAKCKAETRFSANSTLVHMNNKTGKSSAWPEPIREVLRRQIQGDVEC